MEYARYAHEFPAPTKRGSSAHADYYPHKGRYAQLTDSTDVARRVATGLCREV